VSCLSEPWPGGREFLRRLNAEAARRREPISASLELTRRCNLGCVHCYLPRRPDRSRAELSGAEVRSILDQTAAAGCLSLLLTGGEPLLRDDFPELYRHARELGLIVVLFTNATRVDDRVISALRANPPQEVEVTLLGATAATHDALTGVPGSFEAGLEGVRRMLAAGLRVNLKTVLMEPNCHALGAMEALARELKVRFRFDPAVFPRLDRDPAPLAYRVAAETAIALDLADPGRCERWRIQHDRPTATTHDRLYTCGAGTTHFHVTAQGWLQPCSALDRPRFDLRCGTLAQGWARLAAVREQRSPAHDVCQACEHRALCNACPALNSLETGDPARPSEYLCALGTLRGQQLRNLLLAERNIA